MSIDFGLDDMDARILKHDHREVRRRPGRARDASAAAIGEDANTIEEVYEPFLVQNGFLQRTPRGRMATPNGVPPLRLRRSGRASPRNRCSTDEPPPGDRTADYDYALPPDLIAQRPTPGVTAAA